MIERASLLDFLRERTREQHAQLESLPFWTALASGRLPLSSYIELLRAFEIVHDALDRNVSRCDDPAVRAFHTNDTTRISLLKQDLANAASASSEASAAMLHVEVLADRIAEWADSDPAALLGCLYVVNGSALGGPLVAAMVVRGFGSHPSAPIGYVTFGERSIAEFWNDFSRRMRSVSLSPSAMDRAASAAGETFDALAGVLQQLGSVSPDPSLARLQALNEHAGRHAISTDLREVRAALRAGRATWHQYPYYARRYGDRGRKFTRSDSTWLAMLAHLPESYVKDQIGWLGRVLACRGMPRILLEEHLSTLHRELRKAVPEKSAEYDKLGSAAAHLRAERLRRISEKKFEALAESFERRVNPLGSQGITNMGRLLVAAVTDEAAGLDKAVPSLEAWLTDKARFRSPWIDAVHATLIDARSAIRD